MTALRAAVVAEARTWIGTPFKHKQRTKGAGVDCSNLVIGTGENSGAWAINLKRLRKVWEPFYGRRPDPVRMRRALVDLGLVPIKTADVQPGDVAWMHWGNEFPIHMAIVTNLDGRDGIIEAVWNHKVVEATFNDFRKSRVMEYFRYPGLA